MSTATQEKPEVKKPRVKPEFLIDAALEAEIQKDPVGAMIYSTISEGLHQVNLVNDVLLEQTGTPTSDIDKAMKDEAKVKGYSKELQKNIADWNKAKEALKVAQNAARNLFRTEVLEEETKDDSDVDKDAAQDQRKMVVESIKFFVTYCETHKKSAFKEWAEKLQVPQVGRQGSSSASGNKKPRVYVKVDENETPYGSFTEAAAGLSSKDKKYTAAQLAEAWNAANGGQEGTFEFDGHTFVITPKPGKNAK